jgi:quercetin dioxygenase-like cupin family protein
MDNLKSKRLREFPEVITRLPEADMPIKGVKAWILQGERHQLVFFEFESSAQVPEHNHDYAQWGMMIEGKMELTIDDKTRLIEKGDEYVIPAKAKHYVRFLSKCRVMDLFSEKTRYRAKSVK